MGESSMLVFNRARSKAVGRAGIKLFGFLSVIGCPTPVPAREQYHSPLKTKNANHRKKLIYSGVCYLDRGDGSSVHSDLTRLIFVYLDLMWLILFSYARYDVHERILYMPTMCRCVQSTCSSPGVEPLERLPHIVYREVVGKRLFVRCDVFFLHISPSGRASET